MKIHEYQAKAILSQYGIPVPRGEVAFTAEEAEIAAKTIGGSVVVKAQIHAGGRGKGGGVKIAKSKEEVRSLAELPALPQLQARFVGTVQGPMASLVGTLNGLLTQIVYAVDQRVQQLGGETAESAA